MTSEFIVSAAGKYLQGRPPGDAEVWTLNRPHVRNALNPFLVETLRSSLEAAEKSGVRVVVLRGNGPSFCAGADLRYLQSYDASAGETPRDFLRSIWDLTIAMERSPVVFVAALHGHAVAGGLELALACDVVLAEEGTLIGDGHVGRNLLAGGGASARLERSLGRNTALWLALTGTLLRAGDPALAGWLRCTTPAGRLDSTTEDIVAQLVSVPAPAQRAYKSVLNEQVPRPSEAERDRELDAFDRHWVEQNVPENLRLFLSQNRKAS
ncbi:enoyl-CoA hydratase/isomerase family protein [Pseudarthrobacter sp. AG30]|uniref:enoyl-CoA hydratase/isomerase family protein n=1 Tax=Pseudarthrobacter sp. AG30 TaxID=2249742 RepID=UPI000D6E3A3F|nr:enoyl-CoA hydratase/isomerase family protein [Pseudarthrobacter sp. AG30]RAX14756.1 enoyl-CoA hydratase/isomerase family protein [Pseudarthrobacter sp. AG30]